MWESLREAEEKDEPRHEDSPAETVITLRSYQPGKNFSMIDNRLFGYYMPLMGTNSVALYCVYVRLRNNDTGYAYPSLTRLAEITGLSRRTIIRVNGELV